MSYYRTGEVEVCLETITGVSHVWEGQKRGIQNWRRVCLLLRAHRDFPGEQEGRGRKPCLRSRGKRLEMGMVWTFRGSCPHSYTSSTGICWRCPQLPPSDLLGCHTVPSCLFPLSQPVKLLLGLGSPIQIAFLFSQRPQCDPSLPCISIVPLISSFNRMPPAFFAK